MSIEQILRANGWRAGHPLNDEEMWQHDRFAGTWYALEAALRQLAVDQNDAIERAKFQTSAARRCVNSFDEGRLTSDECVDVIRKVLV